MERYNIRLLMSDNNIPSGKINKSVITNKGQKKKDFIFNCGKEASHANNN